MTPGFGSAIEGSPFVAMRVAAFATLVLCDMAGCATTYTFRDGDRPVFERTVSTDEVAALRATGARILDVRLQEDFEAHPVLIPGSTYRNPEHIAAWSQDLAPKDGPVIVYCVRGKWVSQKAATYLAAHGFDVYTLVGGIEAWEAEGKGVEASRP